MSSGDLDGVMKYLEAQRMADCPLNTWFFMGRASLSPNIVNGEEVTVKQLYCIALIDGGWACDTNQ